MSDDAKKRGTSEATEIEREIIAVAELLEPLLPKKIPGGHENGATDTAILPLAGRLRRFLALRSNSATQVPSRDEQARSLGYRDAKDADAQHANAERVIAEGSTSATPARLDKDGTAKPLTEIREVFAAGDGRERTLFHGAGDGYVLCASDAPACWCCNGTGKVAHGGGPCEVCNGAKVTSVPLPPERGGAVRSTDYAPDVAELRGALEQLFDAFNHHFEDIGGVVHKEAFARARKALGWAPLVVAAQMSDEAKRRGTSEATFECALCHCELGKCLRRGECSTSDLVRVTNSPQDDGSATYVVADPRDAVPFADDEDDVEWTTNDDINAHMVEKAMRGSTSATVTEVDPATNDKLEPGTVALRCSCGEVTYHDLSPRPEDFDDRSSDAPTRSEVLDKYTCAGCGRDHRGQSEVRWGPNLRFCSFTCARRNVYSKDRSTDYAPADNAGPFPVGARVRVKVDGQTATVVYRPPPRYVRIRYDFEEPGGTGHPFDIGLLEEATPKRSDGHG